MATSTTTISPTTIMSGVSGAESDPLYCFRSLYDAYASCRRRKRNTINALRFEALLFDNLLDLRATLSDGAYKPSRSVCFVAKQPKLREIFAADFRDRVVHHLLVPQIEKIFEPKFIHDSYACRLGKGTHAAVQRLLELKDKLGEFLEKRLELELKIEFTLKRVSEGSDFLGYIVRPDYIFVRNRVIGNLRARLRLFQDEMVQYVKLKEEQCIRIHLREENVSKLRQTLASYLGHFKHANAYRLVNGLFEKYSYLKDIFALDATGHLIPRYEPPFVPAGLHGQYKWAIGQYPGHCIFFQVGKFCEFYGYQAERYGEFYGLKPQPATRMNALQCGFPLRFLKEFKDRAFQEGLPYVVVAEQGYYATGLKKRVITEIFQK